MAFASSLVLPTLTSLPHASVIYSSGPKHLVDTTGRPLARASTPGIQKVSFSLAITKML